VDGGWSGARDVAKIGTTDNLLSLLCVLVLIYRFVLVGSLIRGCVLSS